MEGAKTRNGKKQKLQVMNRWRFEANDGLNLYKFTWEENKNRSELKSYRGVNL